MAHFASGFTEARAEDLTALGGYDEADGRVARLLRQAGYLAQRQSFCVAVTRSVNPTEMEFAARVRRIVDAIDDVSRL